MNALLSSHVASWALEYAAALLEAAAAHSSLCFLYPFPSLRITRCKRICSEFTPIRTDTPRDAEEVIFLHDAISYCAGEATAINLLEE
eukprot:COSAG02_NODE_1478_length_12404_cov_353.335067_2_plen_88_part_00